MGIANGRFRGLVAPVFVAFPVLAAATALSQAQSPGPLTPDDLSFQGQIQGNSSPTFAASPQGSPYSAVYSRTFGTSGEPPAAAPKRQPDPAPSAIPSVGGPPVVYIIDSSGLLTYRKEDYAVGSGAAIARNPLPSNDSGTTGTTAPAQVPTVADNLYRQPPLETAAGPSAAGPAKTDREPADPGAVQPQ